MNEPPTGASRRRQIGDRAKNSGVPTETALRSYFIERLLARLEASGGDRWILKGAQALMMRAPLTRDTTDLDLRPPGTGIDRALEAFIGALASDLGDGCTFEARRRTRRLDLQVAGGHEGAQVAITARLGATAPITFHVDIVEGREPTGRVERLLYPLPIDLPDHPATLVSVLPLVDHIADKVWASLATYGTASSSRGKDLYDLCVMRSLGGITGALSAEALEAERISRGLAPAGAFQAPTSMRSPFERLSRREPNRHVPPLFFEANAVAKALVDPALQGTALGREWDPSAQAWRRNHPQALRPD
jgi:hypothetical protein